MNTLYSSLLQDPFLLVAEPPAEYHFLSERHLQVIWLEQKYIKELYTSEGLPIQVISPGFWNAEAGPDFKKAHLKIGDEEIKGDVEIHLSQDGWREHRHDLDARYNDVILHVCLWKPNSEGEIKTQSGKKILHCYLENRFTISHTRIVQLIDLDLYPYRKFVGSGKCAQAIFCKTSEKNLATFFKDAADWRLQQKEKFLAAHAPTPNGQLALGIAMALGYKNNTLAFMDLFLWLKTLETKNEEALLAFALNACGFFSSNYQERWKDSEKYRHLKEIASVFGVRHTHKAVLALNQIRPLNHPIRRFVVMVKLMTDRAVDVLWNRMVLKWEKTWMYGRWGGLLDDLCSLLPTYQDSYWNHHYFFEKEPKQEYIPLGGDDLKTKVILNTFFPLLRKKLELDSKEGELAAFFSFYSSIPASNAGKTRYLTHRFFGDMHKGEVLNSAFTEQGAYQVHHDFCLHFEASCEGCPFIERYSNKMGVSVTSNLSLAEPSCTEECSMASLQSLDNRHLERMRLFNESYKHLAEDEKAWKEEQEDRKILEGTLSDNLEDDN